MASPNLYVNSVDGVDTDNGTTWALAKETIAGAAAIDSTTDNRIWVSSSHNESTAVTQLWNFAGTSALPTWVVCVNDTGDPEPPTAIATTAVCTTTGTASTTINGNCYVYGITLNCGSGAVNANITQDNASTSPNSWQTYEQCNFQIVATGGSANVIIGAPANAYPSRIHWKDCGLKLANAVGRIILNFGEFVWDGGSIISGSTANTAGLIVPAGSGEFTKATVSGVDLSNLGSASYLVGANSGSVNVVFRNCKLPASWTGGLITGTLRTRDRAEMYNCDNADTNYRIWIVDYCGTLREDASIYRDSGALSDTGAVQYSWQMVSTADAEFPHMTFRSAELGTWNSATSGTVTATVEIVHDSQGSGTNGALRDDEIWLEIMYLGTTGLPLGTWASDRCGNLNLNSDAADQASSSEAWTGDSAGWDTQKLAVSFDPKEAGYIVGVVHLAKASATVYVDPKLTLA